MHRIQESTHRVSYFIVLFCLSLAIVSLDMKWVAAMSVCSLLWFISKVKLFYFGYFSYWSEADRELVELCYGTLCGSGTSVISK